MPERSECILYSSYIFRSAPQLRIIIASPNYFEVFQKPAIRDIEQMQRPVCEIHPLLRDGSSGLLQKLNLEPHGANGRDAVQFGRPDDARLFG